MVEEGDVADVMPIICIEVSITKYIKYKYTMIIVYVCAYYSCRYIYIYYTSSHVTVVEGYLPRALAGLHIIYVST